MNDFGMKEKQFVNIINRIFLSPPVAFPLVLTPSDESTGGRLGGGSELLCSFFPADKLRNVNCASRRIFKKNCVHREKKKRERNKFFLMLNL